MSIISGTKLAAPIGLQEVYSLLGVSKTGTYYDVGYICSNSHGRINKWARNKPIRVNTPTEITEAQKQGVNFGLTMPVGYAQDYMEAINNATYAYNAPRPGTDWCRLTDFVNYSHIAKSPALDCEDLTFDYTITEGQCTFNLLLDHYGHDSYNIGMDEIPGLSSRYLACILVYNNGSGSIETLWKTSDKTLGQMGTSVTFDLERGRTMLDAKYYLCAASRQQNAISGTFSNVDFYGLPFSSPSGASARYSVTKTNPFTVTVQGGTDVWSSSTYIAAGDVYPGGLAYFIDGSSGFWLQSQVTAKVSYAIDITDLRGEIRPAWTYGSSPDYQQSTTGQVPMSLARLEGGTWKLYNGGVVSFAAGRTYTIRVGRTDWAWYLNGVKQSSLSAQRTAETAAVIITDLKSGYGLGAHSGCRMIGPT